MLEKVLDELETLPPNSAMKIPVQEFGDLSAGRVRSAVSRATRSRHINISTHFDGEFLYVWKPASGTDKKNGNGSGPARKNSAK